MKSPFAYPAFRSLFAAQVCSLVAVGLLTVGLSMAAYRIGGAAAAGQILGLLFALKMVAYVGFAPLAEPLLSRWPRKRVMVALDLARLALLLPMAFVTQTWEIGALAFAFFVVSSGFTPLFQTVIPDLLTDEGTYTRALVISRIAYTLESVLSPVIAAVALQLIAPSTLFLISALAFVGSVAALAITGFPAAQQDARKRPFLARAVTGLRIFHKTPRLRGLFLLNLALSLMLAWVLVNTVGFAGLRLGDAAGKYPILMAFYGAGAAMGALIVPRALARFSERRVMALGVFAFAALGALILLPLSYPALLALWAGFGLASSLVMTPGGLVIVRSAGKSDRAALFAAQFSLSHFGWLIAYPLAGWLGGALSLETALVVLCALALAVALAGLRIWPADDPLEREHSHPELPPDHPHLRNHPGHDNSHRHAFHIDELHPRWA
ncbi:MFS transporter [Oceaniglobus trochenteri]|uniref:MFS transporter n=1 Tax=Oceaniglobus trochenteri TaxID=2763260 RepID=UPI001CFF62FA|nr:MFS transporter [Oceaniglobus trochenteri]